MDEEQGLVSPIAGGIRGIRRSVSSSSFTGRAVPPPVQPDPITTNLISQNSLSLTRVSSQLETKNTDALFISCTALPVLNILDKLEQAIQKPVLSSNQTLIWDTIRSVGYKSPIKGYGKLLEN